MNLSINTPIFQSPRERKVFMDYIESDIIRIRKEIAELYASGMTDNEVARELSKHCESHWEEYRAKHYNEN